MVDAMRVQCDALRQITRYFIGGGDAAHEISPSRAALLSDRDDRGNHVAGMVHVRGEKSIVEIQLADCSTVCPRAPFTRHQVAARCTKDRGATRMRVRKSLGTRIGNRTAQ